MSRSLTSTLFKAARASATGRSVGKGRIINRAANKAIGRAIPWNRIWR
jgi:hypothetical protein